MGQTLLEREEALEWEAGLQELHGRIASRFSRSESRQRVLAYLPRIAGVGWSARTGGSWPNMLATPPDGVQRLLAVYHWDADQVRATCKGTWWSIWAIPAGCWWWMRRGF